LRLSTMKREIGVWWRDGIGKGERELSAMVFQPLMCCWEWGGLDM